MAIGSRQLVGREEELASLLRVLDAPDGLPAAAIVAGEAGIGKTALWITAVDAGQALGYTVLSSRPAEAEARFSFSGLADLVGGVAGRVLPELPTPQRRALETALALSDAEEPVEERLVAFALLTALRRLAEENRVLLAVDDVQWLDAPSVALLGYVLSRFESEPVAALFTARGEVPDWLRREAAEDRLLVLEPGPLSVGAVHELLRTRLGAALPRPVLLRIWKTSGGNPFFALELGRALERRGRALSPGEELPLPPSLGELVQERLEGVGKGALEVARVVAALAEPTVRLVELATDARVSGLEQALADSLLELDGERLRFTHPFLASAVSSGATPAERRALHRRLARIVPEPEARARHLALAAAGADDEAASALEDAAQHARARGAPAAAAELAEQALRLTPAVGSADRHRRMLAAADRHFDAGDIGRALTLLEEAEPKAPRGPTRAAVLLRLARLRAEVGGPDDATALLHEALEEASGDDELVAWILLELGEFARRSEGAEKALRYVEAAVDAAARVADDELNCRVLGTYALVHFNAGRGIAEEAMERALVLEAALAEGSAGMAATPFLVHVLVWSGQLARARETIERWLTWASARDHMDVSDAHWYLALLEWRVGNWDAATHAASAAVALGEQFGREMTTIGSWPSAVVAAHRGDVDRARELVRRGLAAPGVPPVAQAGFEWVLGFLDLSVGDYRGALEHLDRQSHPASLNEPVMQRWLPDLLDALLAAGELERAEGALVPWEERARALDRPWALAIAARTRALLYAARRDLESAFACFDESLAEHARAQDPFQHARTLLALGATQRRAKQRGAARATLEQALAVFARLPAPLWAEKARAELARIGGRAPSQGLTEAERRIARLVAEGRTNREVASALFLTERSVETVLSRVYGKLGVRSRTELAGRFAREVEDPAANS